MFLAFYRSRSFNLQMNDICICICTLQQPLLALRDGSGGVLRWTTAWLTYGPFEGVKRAHSHYLFTKSVPVYDCLHKERVPVLLAIAMWHHQWSTVGTGWFLDYVCRFLVLKLGGSNFLFVLRLGVEEAVWGLPEVGVLLPLWWDKKGPYTQKSTPRVR